MAVRFFIEDVNFIFPKPNITRKWLHSIALQEGFFIIELNYIFCSDHYLLDINKQYLQHDYFTDVITFDHSESETEIHGDIYISIERVQENSLDFKTSFDIELLRVLAHGLLHLCGYSDKSGSELVDMRNKENTYLSLWNN